MSSLFSRVLLGSVLSVSFLFPVFVIAQTNPASTQEYQAMIDKLLEDQKQQLLKATALQQNITSSTLDVKITPQNPGPEVPVVISLESYLTDLFKSDISWSLNDKVVLRGIGSTSFTFQNGQGGQTTKITVTITTNTGDVTKRDFYFTPAGVTLLWAADTYTPPFYKGKAMMVPQASVRFVAVPNTAGIAGSDNLVYTWEKNGYVNTGASGYGKNVYSFTGPDPLVSTKVKLSVSSLDDRIQSEMNLYLPQKRPLILFYENDPLLGVLYNKPLDSEFTLTNRELSISAEPYFFSNERDKAQPLKYTWSINDNTTKNTGRGITLRNDAGTKGSSLVSLVMRGGSQKYQSAEKKLKINFTEGGSSARPIF